MSWAFLDAEVRAIIPPYDQPTGMYGPLNVGELEERPQLIGGAAHADRLGRRYDATVAEPGAVVAARSRRWCKRGDDALPVRTLGAQAGVEDDRRRSGPVTFEPQLDPVYVEMSDEQPVFADHVAGRPGRRGR
ncbi:MAG: hypothetical protein ABIZ52_04790 [Candidatus Limnocylindrales bacterium]